MIHTNDKFYLVDQIYYQKYLDKFSIIQRIMSFLQNSYHIKWFNNNNMIFFFPLRLSF